ncbi:hypothetical protein M407DRAFT_28247 [Tulasnella calospora MUT 4182]|uniref:Uncharacterized protein n=1 Tax=Tulasnella calospora MUT 4182 TaxID=1051891 RepID=A0A0C3KLF6_9AGAM|nr:hypothetical protein M407DRAFT_28247 [Tulasnella calospora MUT 4182]
MKLKEIHWLSTLALPLYSGLLRSVPGPASGGGHHASCNNGESSTSTLTMLPLKGLEASSRPARGHCNVTTTISEGVTAAGMENGELSSWDAARIVIRMHRPRAPHENTIHPRPIRALDFNDFPAHLISAAAINRDVWDLKNSSEPYSPGARISKFKSVAAGSAVLVTRNANHTEPTHALDSNDLQIRLVSFAPINGDFWDLNDSSKSSTPGARKVLKHQNVIAMSWTSRAHHIFAGNNYPAVLESGAYEGWSR